MVKPRASVLWTIDKEKYQDLVNASETLSEVLRNLNMVPHGGNVHTLKKVLNAYRIDYSKFSLGLNHNKGKRISKVFKITNEELFTQNNNHSRAVVKKRILKQNIIPYKCAICGQEPIWNGKELVLVLDHINGINNDNRLENLRFLCPNCNAQQDTFCGKAIKQIHKNKKQKEKLEQIFLEDINEKCTRILNYGIDFSKFGWVEKVAKLENTSHISVRRFMRKYMKDFYYTNCYIRKNQFDK